MLRIVCNLMSAVVMLFATEIALAQPEPAQVMEMRRMKVEAESRVSQIKARYATTAHQYIQARAKYGVARAQFEGLLAFMKQAILNGNPDLIRTNEALDTASSEARTAALNYFDYADRALGVAQSKSTTAIIAVIASGVAVVLDILKGVETTAKVASDREAARKSVAESLEKELAWKTWEELPK
jgi:hypothetical protein